MAFSNDEQLLNDINLSSIKEYAQFIAQLRPLLLQESGFTEVSNPEFQQGLLERQAKVSSISQRIDDQLSAQKNSDGTPKFTREQIVNAINQSPEIQAAIREVEAYKANTPAHRLEKTPERKALEERFKKLEEQQLALTEQQLERQQKALRGEIPMSETLKKQAADEFNVFKEQQARAGNIIIGDSYETAVGKGDAAIKNLSAYKDRVTAAKERELQAIIHGETPLAYGGFELASGATGSRAYSMPGFPDIGGLSQLTLGAQQPFQFNRQLQYNYDALQAQKSENKKNRRAQMLSGGLQLAAMLPFAFGGAGAAGAAGGAFGGYAIGGGRTWNPYARPPM